MSIFAASGVLLKFFRLDLPLCCTSQRFICNRQPTEKFEKIVLKRKSSCHASFDRLVRIGRKADLTFRWVSRPSLTICGRICSTNPALELKKGVGKVKVLLLTTPHSLQLNFRVAGWDHFCPNRLYRNSPDAPDTLGHCNDWVASQTVIIL